MLGMLVAMSFISTMYFYIELCHLTDKASELQVRGEEKDAEMQTLKLFIEEKDAQVRELNARARGAERVSRERSEQKDALMQTLGLTIQEKDAQIRELSARATRVERVRRELESTASASAITTAKQEEELERLRAGARDARQGLEQQSRLVDSCRQQTVSMQTALAEAKAALAESQGFQPLLKDLDDRLRYSEEERSRLLSDINVTHTMALEADARAENALFCCDSVPMCNLCRMRR